MAEKVVFTLPITLPQRPKLGLAITPFVMSLMAAATGVESVLCLNKVGMRYQHLHNEDLEERQDTYLRLLSGTGAMPDHLWTDNGPEYIGYLEQCLRQLADRGFLKVNDGIVFGCACGRVEISEVALIRARFDQKLLTYSHGVWSCKVCSSALTSKKSVGLYFYSQIPNVSVYPNIYQVKVKAMREDLDHPWLVSRTARDGTQVKLKEQSWVLDTDFAWAFVHASLVDSNLIPTYSVVSNRNLKQMIWVAMISNALQGKFESEIIVTPYINIKTSNQGGDLQDWEYLLHRYGKKPLRFLIAQGVRWSSSDLTLDSSALFWALKALQSVDYALDFQMQPPASLADLLNQTNGARVQEIMAAFRKQQAISDWYAQFLLKGK